MGNACSMQPGGPMAGPDLTVESASGARAARAPRAAGISPAWQLVLRQVERVAQTDTTVLVTGESGTGKEVIANLVHESSRRGRKRLVAVSCAALPESLLESELFGYDKGAFTGAVRAKMGRVEQASGGTLFLDEVAEMSPRVQAKFLRLLEEREFQRVGGTRTLRADIRVIAATHRDLAAGIAQGTFRADLYYRLNVFGIHIPPLRARLEDIPALADAFLEELSRTMGRRVAGIARQAYERLLAYHWPGNARELRNVIERAVLFCDGGTITPEHLPPVVARAEAAGPYPEAAPSEPVARRLVEKALAEAMGNKTKAAQILGMTRGQFFAHLARYGLH